MTEPMAALLQQQLSKGDPQLAQLAQFLTRREEQLTRELADEEAERALALSREASSLRRLMDEMSARVDTLQHRLDELAGALGACPGCWGTDPDCRYCRGHGRPGQLPPDKVAFDQLVLPAVRTHTVLSRRSHPRQTGSET
ncbi:hypothetical protein [Nonomuraea endophytica]|uniref:Uncharacterized protein n=1 Tax=Nonomuraea endophytica TaxID=714136 RepID=A0A7W8EE99_9ACTN|nr:hypothetical protein [Nonomuraea endophytica]MBB5076374.1 hypothetical protein [Nonomuraea endophytica]